MYICDVHVNVNTSHFVNILLDKLKLCVKIKVTSKFMAIRIRKRNGLTIALCAAETDSEYDDIYLDDNIHYALAAKFALDWQNQTIDWQYKEQWEEMDLHKKRDAKEEIEKWIKENEKQR